MPRYKTTIVIEVYTSEPYDPETIQDIANEVEHEAGEGSIVSVESKEVPDEED